MNPANDLDEFHCYAVNFKMATLTITSRGCLPVPILFADLDNKCESLRNPYTLRMDNGSYIELEDINFCFCKGNDQCNDWDRDTMNSSNILCSVDQIILLIINLLTLWYFNFTS